MSLYDEIQNWGDWSKKNRSSGDENLKYLCHSKREVSQIQLLVQGMMQKLNISLSQVDHEIIRQLYKLQMGTLNYTSNFVKLIEGLNIGNSNNLENNKDFYNNLESISWSKISSQLDSILSTYDQLPLSTKELIKIPSSLFSEMLGLCLNFSVKVNSNRFIGILTQDDFEELIFKVNKFLNREIIDFINKNNSDNYFNNYNKKGAHCYGNKK